MEIQSNREQENLIIKLSGHLDTLTAPELEEKVNLDGVTFFELDLQKVDYVSSAGLRLILSFHKKMQENKGKLVISHLSAGVKEVFDMVGYSAILNIK